MKLSIIICLYNTPLTLLEECLASIARAALPPLDYETVVVDDGSDADYSDIAKKYGAVYEKKKRDGTLSARLRGIELAQGEYIAFVDSDDTVGFNYYAPMIRRAEGGFDIVFNSWAFRTEGTRYVCVEDDTVSGNILSDEPLATYLSREGRQHSYYVMWNKVYKSELLRRVAREISDLDTPHFFCFSEDALLNLYAFSLARKVASVSSGYYFYRMHSGQTVNVSSREKLIYQIDCMSYTLEKCKKQVAGHEKESELSEKIDAWAALMARSHFAHARRAGYVDVYPYIMEKYGVSDLCFPTRRDERVYEKVKLLPSQVEKIEASLLSLCSQGDTIKVKKPRRGGYAELLLRGLTIEGWKVEYRRDYTALPSERVSPIKRIIFNSAVRRLGALLFKKGSRIRAFLKRFI